MLCKRNFIKTLYNYTIFFVTSLKVQTKDGDAKR